MDPNQQILGAAYAQQLMHDLQPQTPFADYDVLTPDEPIWAWQLVKHLLHAPGKSQVSQSSSPNSNRAMGDRQPAAVSE